MIETEHGIFTDNDVTGQAAQEVYEEWLANRDKKPVKLPTEQERIEMLEQVIIYLSMEG